MKRSPNKTAAQWEELVSEYIVGTQSEREFCARLDIKLVTLRKWRYHFKAKNNASKAQAPSRFVQVNVSDKLASHQHAVLCIGPDVRLECPAAYDVDSLAALALAVHHGR